MCKIFNQRTSTTNSLSVHGQIIPRAVGGTVSIMLYDQVLLVRIVMHCWSRGLGIADQEIEALQIRKSRYSKSGCPGSACWEVQVVQVMRSSQSIQSTIKRSSNCWCGNLDIAGQGVQVMQVKRFSSCRSIGLGRAGQEVKEVQVLRSRPCIKRTTWSMSRGPGRAVHEVQQMLVNRSSRLGGLGSADWEVQIVQVRRSRYWWSGSLGIVGQDLQGAGRRGNDWDGTRH